MKNSCIPQYVSKLTRILDTFEWSQLSSFTEIMFEAWKEQRNIFICGNGGSAGNANHIANDFSYGVNPNGKAFSVESLSANNAIITCLANDTGYDNIYAQQLFNKGKAGDILIVLSGSGNSANILSVLEQAKSLNMTSCAVLGFSGGKAKELADHPLHFPVDDMQIAEDLQLIVGHMLMKDLHALINN